jgi:hypothetical protein
MLQKNVIQNQKNVNLTADRFIAFDSVSTMGSSA